MAKIDNVIKEIKEILKKHPYAKFIECETEYDLFDKFSRTIKGWMQR